MIHHRWDIELKAWELNKALCLYYRLRKIIGKRVAYAIYHLIEHNIINEKGRIWMM